MQPNHQQCDEQCRARIRKHIRKLRRGAPVRVYAEAILSGEELDTHQCTTVLQVMLNPSGEMWRERTVAAWCLGERVCSPPEWKEATAHALRRVVDGREFVDRRGRIIRALKCNLAVAAVLSGAFILFLVSLIPSIGLPPPLFYLVGGWIIGTALLWMLVLVPGLLVSEDFELSRLAESRASAARSLGRLADPLASAVLARAATDARREVRQAAAVALPHALAAIGHEHLGALPPETTTNLCALLGRNNSALEVLVLDALECAGTGAAAEPVRRLASRSKSGSIRDAAARVLPILDERLRQETSATRLLRPAGSPNASSDVLLRPASSATAVPEEQLLRPTSEPTGMSD